VNVVTLNPKPDTTSITVNVELPTEIAALVNKFISLNQHTRNNVLGHAGDDAPRRRCRRCEG
jgi:hypothetical protein